MAETQTNINIAPNNTQAGNNPVAVSSVPWAGGTSDVQAITVRDPITGNGESVTPAGTNGANAAAVQGITGGVSVGVTQLGCKYLNIGDNSPHTITGAVAVIGLENLSGAAQSVTVTLYDNTAASGTVIGGPYTLGANQILTFPSGGKLVTVGLTAQCSAAPAGSGIQVLYRTQ